MEELLQSDAVGQLQNTAALKLIVYELVLMLSQKSTAQTSQPALMTFPSRVLSLLASLRPLLAELLDMSEQMGASGGGREGSLSERTFRNKQRIFTSYYNQFCTLLKEFESSGKMVAVSSSQPQ